MIKWKIKWMDCDDEMRESIIEADRQEDAEDEIVQRDECVEIINIRKL